MTEQGFSPSAGRWARETIGRVASTGPSAPGDGRRRLLLIHLDGVPRSLLNEAVRSGRMPFLSSLVRSGRHHLDHAFWGSPASTPCFQANVLYGLRHPNLPAYEWFDRELGRRVKMNAPKDALAIEERLGRRSSESLLADGGTSYLSLFRAGASNRLCMTALADWKAMLRSLRQDLRGIAATRRRPLPASVWDLCVSTVKAGVDSARWSAQLDDGRHEAGFLFSHFFMMSLGWSLSHSRTVIDMVRGVPVIYLVFGNFDEVAHRRGPHSNQAVEMLYRVDARLEELYAVGRQLPSPYDLVLVADHGHVDAVPLETKFGTRLRPHLMEGPVPPLGEALERALLDGRAPLVEGGGRPALERDPEVVESGNFAHIYLSRAAEPLEARQILVRHREVLSRASHSPALGLVALRRGNSAVALIQGNAYGPHELDAAPLSSAFSKRAVADLLQELPQMPTAGDLVLYGEAVGQGATVGFAWEFGSHGGLTREETDSWVCWPADAPLDLSAIGHATQLHRRLATLYRAG